MKTLLLAAVASLALLAGAADAAALDRSRPFDDIGITEARKHEHLRPVLVAVIDTAVAPAGLELVHGPHGAGDLSASPDSHGSRVAGILADRRPESLGVAPNAVILPIRVFADDDLGQQAPVAAAIKHAVDRGARIINVSANVRRVAELDAALAYATAHDVLVVVAAGNPELDDRTIRCAALATHPDVLTVAAVDISSQLRPAFSKTGAAIDIAAPAAVFSAGGGRSTTGTSFAVPVVSAAAALLLGREPALGRLELAERLLGAARAGNGTPEQVGHGVIDLERLLRDDRRVEWRKRDHGCTTEESADAWGDAGAGASRGLPAASAGALALLALAGLLVSRRRRARRQTATLVSSPVRVVPDAPGR